MNISPILLLSIGATFALLYGFIITIGWAITRKNRRKFHQSFGLNEIELYDLQSEKSLNKYVMAVSLSNNYFKDEKDKEIKPENYECFIVDRVSPKFPKIKRGFLIFQNRESKKIEYAFDVPRLEDYR